MTVRLWKVALIVPFVLAFVACGGGGAGDQGGGSGGEDQVAVGLITKTETNPFFVKMKDGAEQAAEEAGVELQTAAGEFDGDNSGQVTAMENMVTSGVDGILITPNDTEGIVPSIEKAKEQGVTVIALDTPTEPQDATNALFATDNFRAGVLIGEYAKAAMGNEESKIATLDLAPGISVGVLRHNGFLKGFGISDVDDGEPEQVTAGEVVCSQNTQGDQAKGQAAMENCIQSNPEINLVYTINEPAALGAYTALEAAGKAEDTMVVSVDGGCTGVEAVKNGKIAATSQQYPLKMAAMGVKAVADAARGGEKPSGYTDTGVTLITDNPQDGIESKDTQFGLDNCWG